MKYRPLTIQDYDDVINLWRNTEGVKVRDADSKEGILKYLTRNPELSFIAEENNRIVGTIMSGHDGKRGSIQHLAVENDFRKKGIGTILLNRCLEALKEEGIFKSHIHVLFDNESAKTFWKNHGWLKRDDIEVFSYVNSDNKNV